MFSRMWLVVGASASILVGCKVDVISKLSSGSGASTPVVATGAKTANGFFLVAGLTKAPAKTEVARFAAGCFWGVEDYFRHEPGVVATAVGFSGGHVNDPSYRRVCQGDTGHAETVEVEFDPTKTSYRKLVQLYYEIHDPTELNAQGPDTGEQYRSVIFYRNEDQHKIALETKDSLQRSVDFKSLKIVTEIIPAGPFYFAEDYHQQYVEKGGRAYCHERRKRSFGG